MVGVRNIAASLSSVSVLALMASSAWAIVLPPGKNGAPQAPGELSAVAIQRATDKNAKREFTVFLKPEASGAAAAVEGYFSRFGFSTEYHAVTNAVKLHGTYAQAEAAGHFQYVLDNKPRIPMRASVQPSFSSEVASAIEGTTFRRGPLLSPQTRFLGTPSTLPCYEANDPFSCGFGPADYAVLYDRPASLNGAGEYVDIAAFSTFCPSDISTFATDFGVHPAPRIVATYLSGQPSGCGTGEPTLDLSRVYGTAPGASIRIWFADGGFLSSLADMYEDIANDQKAHPAAAVTTSYGLYENILGAEYASAISLIDVVDRELDAITGGAAEKVALFAASGDLGAFCLECSPFGSNGFEASGVLSVLFPASDRFVMAVGGTTLYPKAGAKPGKDTRQLEACWSGSASSNFGGSGGGVSSIFGTPPWQKGVVGTASQTFKNVPDMSLVADANTPSLFVFGGELLPTGGTSAASPTWAGIAALVNEARVLDHVARLTNWPTELYTAAKTASTTPPFTKMTEGFNGFYGASSNVYNNCAGLGVPNITNLVNALK